MQILKTICSKTLAASLLLASVGCSANSAKSVQAAGPTNAQSSKKAGSSSASFAFTEADLAAYEKGLAQETVLVLAARERGNNAKTPEARAAAAQNEWEGQTIPGGAKAAGLPIERYRNVRKAVNRVLETLDFQGKIDGPLDLEHASPEMKQRLNNDAFAEVPPSSAAALRVRMSSLVPVWVRYMELTAVNG